MESRLLENQKRYRKNSGNKSTKKYEKTINGFLMRKYRNMKSRVLGIQKEKAHLYKDKKILSKEDFYTWAKNNEVFLSLYNKWVQNDYDRRLCPTVDRINAKKGYVLSNMEWITHSENSRRGALNRHFLEPCSDIVEAHRRFINE